jgi:antitoxin MazE
MYSMTTTIKECGNSQGIRLPKEVLQAALLDENEEVEVIADETGIHIRKAQMIKTLTELFKNYHGDYKPHEWETGAPAGKEVF